MTAEFLIELVARIIPNEKGCKIWPLGKLKGYGSIRFNNKTESAHRTLYKLLKNPELPDNIVLRHTCDRRPCVNIEHLLEGTFADNSADMVERGRQTYGQRNARAKLKDEEVYQLRELFVTGQYTQAEIGKKFGISRRQAGRIVTNKSQKKLLELKRN